MARIETVEALRRLYKTPTERALRKQLDHLDRHCRRFIELSPFLLLSSSRLASSAASGLADVSPRGDQPGFVQALDDRTLAIPDRPGNNRLDSLSNIVGNPPVGLIFLIPGFQETLRVNGAATVEDDLPLRERFAVAGKLPVTVIVVSVAEAYLHCAKSILRARLWDQEARAERALLPSMGQMIKDQAGLADPAESQDEMIARYQAVLY